ncbi:MAG TPA: PQQ-binding-like beta-propeller repeat protein [Pirellulaceae bacterium]|jgi:outer membrane protein assembly factor BamB
MKRTWLLLTPFCLALVVWTTVLGPSAPAAEPKVDPLDWPYWRGPEYNSISRETGLPDTINPDGGDGSNLAWKRADLGSRSTPVVLNGKLYTILRADPGTPTEGERVICIDAATGKDVWQSRHNVWSSDVPDTRVGWSSVTADPETGNVYALGACGLFECHNGETGKVLWSIPLQEQVGLVSTYGGRTNFPIIFEDLVILGSVIVNWGDMALPAHRFMAFDKKTGDFRYIASTRVRPPDTIYSAPVLATIGGQHLLIAGASDGWMYALQPRTGKFVWEYQLSRRGLNVSPTVDGDVVYTGHSEENITGTKVGAVVAVDAAGMGNITKSGEIWRELEIADGKSSILKVNDLLYCPDDSGKMFVLNAKDGSPVGRKISLGTINFASPVYADGKIYYVEKNGRWYIMTPDPKEGVKRFERGKSMGMFPGSPQEECWASPVISHGRLFIATTSALYCFEDTAKKHAADKRPALAKESPVDDQKPALLQVSPCELLLGPGDKRDFTVRTYNARGQLLKESPAEFSLDGPGSIDKDGIFTAPKDSGHVATIITAKVGDLSGKARLRIVPKLPWKFDFEGLKDPPITWVGARSRHVMRPVDGSNTMVKITTIPLGTRSRLSMGSSDLHDYTVQCDFKAAPGLKLPDVGVIAQGYTLEVSGENKWLKLMSWIAHDKRTQKELPFDLEPNVWYTLKLRAANDKGNSSAILQGKIWKRDDKEPADWSIEIKDPMPNMTGAPGLFGNAVPPTGEIAIDNVLVTPNSAN